MPDNDLDCIDRAECAAEKLDRGPMITEDLASDFALYGSHAFRRRIQLMTLRNKMGGVHDALRKARR
jgi:hypothetical protein